MTESVASHTVTLRDVLRHETSETHARLHTHALFADLFAGTLTRADYTRLMTRFWGFYAPLDTAIASTIAAGLPNVQHYEYVPRAPYLACDVVDLTAVALNSAEIPQCKRVSEIVTPATLGGVLYVIEGATLGAAQIDRAAKRLLGADGSNGRRFWAWGRAQNKYRWAMANSYLEHLAAQGASASDITLGAELTFAALADWLAPLDRAPGHLS